MKLLCIIPILCLLSCSSEHLENDYDPIMDLNSDGKRDVFYEFDSSGYYELVDRNFDGRVDESHRYNDKNNIISSKVDEDFDGYLETKIFYKYESIEKIAVDIDNNSLYEIFYFYNSGTLKNAVRYYQDNGVKKIGRIGFKFGYPIGIEMVETTTIDEDEFQKLSEGGN